MALKRIYIASHDGVTVRVFRDAEWDEYRVRYYWQGVLMPDSDYFTDDKAEALGMVSIMLRYRPAQAA